MSSSSSPGIGLADKLARLPRRIGVYLLKDDRGRILYVGKAKDLKARVSNYFRAAGDGRPMVHYLRSRAADVEVLVVASEKEALILENELIKKHHPRYNVDFRDDKAFVHLRLDPQHQWPRLTVVRRPKRDGAQYFGPYSDVGAARETLRILQRIFPLRSCSDAVLYNRVRPCLYYQIKECVAPCVGYCAPDEYAELARRTADFLRGQTGEVEADLKAKMDALAGAMRFEEAALVRDRLRAIRHVRTRQVVVSEEPIDRDVFALAQEGARGIVQGLFVREGKLLDSRSFEFEAEGQQPAELLEAFLKQFYARDRFLPDQILVPRDFEDRVALSAWLSERRGRRLPITVPRRGAGRQLLALALKNARVALHQRRDRRRLAAEALEQLQRRFELERYPAVIECYDVSNLQSEHIVASRVRFRDGEPDKAGYRHYRIRTLSGADDFAALSEVLTRRLQRAAESDDLPDLFLIDGGPGQLGSARRALHEAGVVDRDLLAIAKVRDSHVRTRKARDSERLWRPGAAEPVLLTGNDSVLFLLQRVRDEAHRFALSYNRKVRAKSATRSALSDVAGLGPQRRRALLRQFSSLEALKDAAPDELAAVPGIGPELAQRLHQRLRQL
ncbi:MAG TPA: excinuclease ABC subunit UvrC [Acidobacteriota bacterium]